MDLAEFPALVGARGPVAVAGGRTAWEVGGSLAPGTRLVTAPTGVVEHQPAEMTVRVGAGTTVAELDDVLAESGQCVVLPTAPGATVGGVLAVGRSGTRRLGWGPVRDAVLEIRYVGAEGALVTAGGPMIKNVSGFDLCRLLVGSLGTLGLIGEVVLRTRPIPEEERWLTGPVDPALTLDELATAVTVFWDGATTWVRLSGLAADVRAESGRATALGLGPCDRPPEPPRGGRWSLPPAELASLPGRHPELRFLAEMGVGIVHADAPAPARPVAPEVATLHRRIKDAFDPGGRLTPGRDPLTAEGAG